MSRQIGIRASKLLFKGESGSQKNLKKKRKRSSSPTKKKTENEPTVSGWVTLKSLDHFEGPCVIVFPETDPPSILSHILDTEHLAFQSVPDLDPQTYEPTHVQHVFVARKIIKSQNESMWALRTAEGRYLSADKQGVVYCSKEAIGATEEWLPILDLTTQRVSFQSIWNTFLQIDQPNLTKPSWNVRCDAEEIRFGNRFLIKIQSSSIKQPSKKQTLTSNKTEEEVLKQFQSWGSSKKSNDIQDPSTVKRAAQEGKLSEYYLDRREKLKSDRYCK
ncbi:hypothetical protein HMI54_005007 [Coelomomyces lativittatus]|nr:hypothetical protein HMI54_005007 [Coelomomyces lativittatus]KAJ1512848.1 hypothetical protein HMI56_003432 [Coelomomyces lativittatus]KAJ1515753.1 hypothetical protein HMI55_003369 [Coelomomyces lativittatus]